MESTELRTGVPLQQGRDCAALTLEGTAEVTHAIWIPETLKASRPKKEESK